MERENLFLEAEDGSGEEGLGSVVWVCSGESVGSD